MSEIEQLKNRIKAAAYDGLATSIIKDDYEPAGQMMITQLTESGEFVSWRGRGESLFSVGLWTVWAVEFAPPPTLRSE